MGIFCLCNINDYLFDFLFHRGFIFSCFSYFCFVLLAFVAVIFNFVIAFYNHAISIPPY